MSYRGRSSIDHDLGPAGDGPGLTISGSTCIEPRPMVELASTVVRDVIQSTL